MNPFFHRFLMLAVGLILSTAAAAAPSVEIQTSMGKVVIELDSEKAPVTVKTVSYTHLDVYKRQP